MTLPSHTQVILGPPGTGKTSTLLGLIEDELEKGTTPTKIGFFTFTKKAVNEGKQRAMDKFELTRKDLPFFRTLHYPYSLPTWCGFTIFLALLHLFYTIFH